MNAPIKKKWPTPKYDAADQPHFLFIITPPYSGSTALASLINTSEKTVFLEKHAEGQWLVPGLCGPTRWDVNQTVDYESVRAVWLHKFQNLKKDNPHVEIVVEKSPPNMVRAQKIISLFEKTSVMSTNRDPYANCASILYRSHEADSLNEKQRNTIITKLAANWITRSTYIRSITERFKAPLITHEELCANTVESLKKIPLPADILSTIDPEKPFEVKDYPPSPIQCFNAKQTSKLKPHEISIISAALAKEPDLLAYFNYTLMP